MDLSFFIFLLKKVMKKNLFVFLVFILVVPKNGFAKLILDLPPVLSKDRTPTPCNSCNACDPLCMNPCEPCAETCCSGTCQPKTFCAYCCDGTCSSLPCCNSCNACDPSCVNPCEPCAGTCCGGTCQPKTFCAYCCDGTCSSSPCPAPPAGKINDTGIKGKAGSSGQEDADYGRDAKAETNSDIDGYAGFSFTKLDSSGNSLADQGKPYDEQPWACVKDKVTGLTWQVLPDYVERPWYNSNDATNGGGRGNQNGIYNTETYVKEINSSGLCGASSGWRLPTVRELFGLANNSKTAMAAEQNYFPGINQSNKLFWSGTPSAVSSDRAWGVNFEFGKTDRMLIKSDTSAISVMLVRPEN